MIIRIIILILVVSVLLFFISNWKTPSISQPRPSPMISVLPSQSVLGQRTKSSECVVNGALPDPLCTPGAIDSSLTKDVLCSPTFSTKSVRNVPASEKSQVYREYGILSHQAGEYEVDHLISLELGGSNDIANLWPEAAEPRPGYHEKDVVENYLHEQVCSGAIDLGAAQKMIAHDWLSIYHSMQ